MDRVKYPTNTEEELSSIHEEHKTQVVKDFTEAAKSLNKALLQRELEVSYVNVFGHAIEISLYTCICALLLQFF